MPRSQKEIPWLEKRDDVYYVYFYVKATEAAKGRTQRISLRTTDSVEAQARYAAYLAQGDQIFADAGRPVAVTVKAALRDYYNEHIAAKVVDKVRAADAIANLVSYFGNTPLTEIDIPTSRGYADARRTGIVGGGRKLRHHAPEGSDSTIRRELVVLRAAANHALRWKRIDASGLPSIELPAEGVREEIWLTQAELALAMGRATGLLRDFMTVAYYTGARRASIERLTKFQVDLAQGRINLSSPHESAIQRRSNKRRPVVPIDPKLRPTLERLMADSPNEWVFGEARDFYRPFHQHLVSVGLPEKAHPHILRHSRATHLLQSGVNIYDVARLLGDTVATVERVYGHHSSDYLATAIGGAP